MKNIIPFKKEVIFKTNLSEITSISLEHTLSIDNDLLKGEFIINGEYKVSDKSTTVLPFELKLPFEIVIDERYDLKKATVDIDDFYYEIINNNVLSINIDVLLDKLEEIPLMEVEELKDVERKIEVLDTIDEDFDINRKCNIEKEDNITELKEEKQEVKEAMNLRKTEEKHSSLFNNFSKENDIFVTYNVVILREGDSIESIEEKYNISKEEIEKYNDLTNLELGTKLIIPNTYERD